VGNAGCRNPEVGLVVFDDIGARIEEAQKHPELDGDQDQRDHDAGECDYQANAVMQ
jgi:hypothetical protein